MDFVEDLKVRNAEIDADFGAEMRRNEDIKSIQSLHTSFKESQGGMGMGRAEGKESNE